MRNNKGQAAMEFLMTYGWAILIVVIAVAALAAFGVFNPQRFAQERCVGESTEFACTSNAVSVDDATDTIQFSLSNGVGETVNITGIVPDADGDCGTPQSWNVTRSGTLVADSTGVGLEIRPNDELIATVVCASGAITADGVFQDNLEMQYDIVDGVSNLAGDVEVVVKT